MRHDEIIIQEIDNLSPTPPDGGEMASQQQNPKDFSDTNTENEPTEEDLYPDVLELPPLPRSPRGSINSIYGSRNNSRNNSRHGSRHGSNCSQVLFEPRIREASRS